MANGKEISLGKTFSGGLWDCNPVLRLLLGMCPTLAVTAAVKPALTMGLSVIFVLLFSNIVVSSIRGLLKPHVRILMFTLTIATAVTIADLALKAFMPDMSEALGPYVALIIVNCLIIGRAEACASKNGFVVSVVDALGMGLGFTITLVILAGIREVLATGLITLSDTCVIEVLKPVSLEGGWFVPWLAMGFPVGAFVTLGLMLGAVNIISKKQKA